MALELDWTDDATGVTYNNAYAVIERVSYTKGIGTDYSFVAQIYIYKDATAYNNGKTALATKTLQGTKTFTSTDTGQTYRNIIHQAYNDMKQEDPWDDASDV